MDSTVTLQAKVLTVSDRVSQGISDDRSGPAVADHLAEHGFDVVDRRCCPDGIEAVSNTLAYMAYNFAGLIVTTGGTGFGPRDATPEGTRRVLDRVAPGFAEAMRAVNPLGRLSRGTAGIRGGSLILNLVGSTSGAVEMLDAVIDVCPHAIELMAGVSSPHPTGPEPG